MPNRIIKESICTSSELDKISAEAEILFYRLIVKADDFGLYYGNPKIIGSYCFPLKEPSEKKLTGWLNELSNVGLIAFYTGDDDKKYIKLLSWDKHQQKRATKSKFPTPKSFDSNCNQVIANVPVNENVNEKRETRNDIIVGEVIAYLNEKAGTNYKPSSKTTHSLINARINEKFTLEDFKTVIDNKCTDWLNDKKMKEFLRPSTLFCQKHFEEYLNKPNNQIKPMENSHNYDMNKVSDKLFGDKK